jgi:hypothetical protein
MHIHGEQIVLVKVIKPQPYHVNVCTCIHVHASVYTCTCTCIHTCICRANNVLDASFNISIQYVFLHVGLHTAKMHRALACDSMSPRYCTLGCEQSFQNVTWRSSWPKWYIWCDKLQVCKGYSACHLHVCHPGLHFRSLSMKCDVEKTAPSRGYSIICYWNSRITPVIWIAPRLPREVMGSLNLQRQTRYILAVHGGVEVVFTFSGTINEYTCRAKFMKDV